MKTLTSSKKENPNFHLFVSHVILTNLSNQRKRRMYQNKESTCVTASFYAIWTKLECVPLRKEYEFVHFSVS